MLQTCYDMDLLYLGVSPDEIVITSILVLNFREVHNHVFGETQIIFGQPPVSGARFPRSKMKKTEQDNATSSERFDILGLN